MDPWVVSTRSIVGNIATMCDFFRPCHCDLARKTRKLATVLIFFALFSRSQKLLYNGNWKHLCQGNWFGERATKELFSFLSIGSNKQATYIVWFSFLFWLFAEIYWISNFVEFCALLENWYRDTKYNKL